ncbi:MAG: ribosome small subunit-dependent GTPase A [Candidatus Eisenbacteria bacterium]|uniref:Small ribosomal subunit biogenesis GTPase RsgA n=1 Tax=Eiseniibacteriota bacterium TaxID=2212470 RepID=A0A948W573_UNCEI|nr:ribosome small subunit-dependent GTPase A [Candidatus Eisenbacteria bacterium]MBU1948791.1 ribosome small subunit-dependent GTPase A [Candidatus Eisenbacteria bacterium]MBU2689291.1 ribosome small subunit-dependent GTPase A [Candidatus Eisenbacteria bacterium]
MDLGKLGFDSWFQERWEELKTTEFKLARVTTVDRERYLVRDEMNEIPAQLAGKLMFSTESSLEWPCVGDWVLVQYHNDGTMAIIQNLLPRKSTLKRKAAGRDISFQIIASNLDVAFIVQSCDTNFNLRRLDRYLVIANQERIEPVILLSKSDLNNPQELERKIEEIRDSGIQNRVITFSNTTGAGLNLIRQTLEKGKTYCLLGSSGVGKTTLLNHLLGGEQFETYPVREKDGRGRHTTVRRQLIMLDNGAMIIDNPGMRELAIMDAGDGVDESFSDIRELSDGCRFRDCTHTIEAGCAILKAVENGDISEERHRSYLKLLKESNYHKMSYMERRRKDKQFGAFCKNAMKHRKNK